MTASFPANPGTKLGTDSRVFLYEVAIWPQVAALAKINGLTHRRGKIYLKVPFTRMSQTLQQISRLQGKILSITPLTSSVQVQPSPPSMPLLPWWVEILTARPHCLYYFGPFDSVEEAHNHQTGYVEDLQGEGAEGIAIKILQGQPQILTEEW